MAGQRFNILFMTLPKPNWNLGWGVSFAISAFQKYEKKCKYTYGTDKEFIPHFVTSFTLFSLRATGRTCYRFASGRHSIFFFLILIRA